MAAIANPAPPTFSDAASSSWVYMGEKWGYSTALGTPGGLVYWSFADLNLSSQLSQYYLDYPTISAPLIPWERQEVRKAVETWSEVGNIDFVEISDSAASNIRFGKAYLDGFGKALAEATIWPFNETPSIKEATIVIDAADQAAPTGALSTPLGFLSTAIHEFGHAIGLDHSANPDAIMYPYYNGKIELSREDINGAQAIYGAAPAASSAAAPAPLLSAAQYTYEASVTRLYLAALNRAPDTIGKQYWVGEMAKGAALRTIADAFSLSPEFAARYGATVSNADFLDHVYHNVLGRTGDAGGTVYWLNELDHGRSRGEVLAGFSESPEHIIQNAAFIDDAVNGTATAILAGVPATGIDPYPWS